MESNPILTVDNLSVHFGGLKAISNVSLELNSGELLGLIGPNGAGKTTFFNALSGFCKPTKGTIIFNNFDISDQPPNFISRKGLARTFQNIRLFKNLTTLDNLRIAFHQNMKYSVLTGIFKTQTFRQEEQAAIDQAYTILDLVGLKQLANEEAKNLSYGDQRKLEIARALILKPKILLLDEPAAGMNPFETKELVNLIRTIRTDFNLSILLIEHDMSLVMNLCEKIYVLDYGKLIAQGDAHEIRANPQVVKAYLGEDA